MLPPASLLYNISCRKENKNETQYVKRNLCFVMIPETTLGTEMNIQKNENVEFLYAGNK